MSISRAWIYLQKTPSVVEFFALSRLAQLPHLRDLQHGVRAEHEHEKRLSENSLPVLQMFDLDRLAELPPKQVNGVFMAFVDELAEQDNRKAYLKAQPYFFAGRYRKKIENIFRLAGTARTFAVLCDGLVHRADKQSAQPVFISYLIVSRNQSVSRR